MDPREEGSLTVELWERPATQVLVLARYNRGLFWWKKIVQHKDRNNPYKFNSYSYDLYKKLELDLNNVSREGFQKVRLLKPFGFIADNIDTTGSRPFLPVYMTETVSKCYSSARPAKKREEIRAVQTNGIKNEGVLHLIAGLGQKVNVYDNEITLFGKAFISPLSRAGDGYYNYTAADTQYIDGQRYLHLFFAPKRPGENTFQGSCWIHHNTWAISQIDLEVSSTANINFVKQLSIRQEFTRYADSFWVFRKDQFVADISPLNKDKISLIARQTALFGSVRVNQPDIREILAANTEPDQVIEMGEAKSRPADYWVSARPEPLSVNERKVYQLVDTLKSMPLFNSYTRKLEFLIGGRIKLGKVEIGPWYKWLSGNQRERTRLRFDLATTDEFSERWKLHGYLAYGIADNQFKGLFETRYQFPGDKGYSLHASYLRDLDNGRSRNDDEGITTDNLFNRYIRRPGIRQKFIRVEEEKIEFRKEWGLQFAAQTYLSYAGYMTFQPLLPVKMIAKNERDISNVEWGIKLRYSPGEKRIVTAHKNIRIQGNHPVIELGYAMGLPGIVGSEYQYHKVNAQVTQRVHLPRWGNLDYQVYGGAISGDALPFMLLMVHPGNETFYYSKQAFNLMNRFEYVSDRYAGFTIEHDFEKKLINALPRVRDWLAKTNIRQFWNVKAVWGGLSGEDKKLNCQEYGNYRMKSLNGKPYIEVGTGLDNIFRYFRMDMVWRVTPSQTTLPRPPSGGNFGVYGSFHLQF